MQSLPMKQISLRISDVEKQHLDRYCELTERNQTDVLRQYVRSLSVSGVLNPIDRPAIPSDTDPSTTVRGS
jgi:hypothetical protein